MMARRSLCGVASTAWLVAIMNGCADTRGPELVVNSHIDYNKAVSQVLKEELLLNVVRRRYMEAPQFLNVSSINSNISTASSIGAGASILGIGRSNTPNASVDGSVAFSDSPTITITPRQGEAMAHQLHEPVKVSTLADLGSVGYPVDFTVYMLAEGINNLRGLDLRYDHFQPASPEWREAVALLQKFYEEGSLVVDRFKWNDPHTDYPFPAASITPEMWITTLSIGDHRWKSYDGGETFHFTSSELAPAVWLDPDVRRTPDGQRLMELLNVDPQVEKKAWLLESARVVSGADLENKLDEPRDSLKLRMRSLYNVLNLYAYGVHVPPEDEQEGRASDLSSFREAVARGEMEDISEVFAIRYCERAPESAFQAVRYRGLWFYIDDRDFESKASFNALYDLWQLSIAAPGGQAQPVTTIQVN
jgi:hypothetical protein